MKDLIIKNPDGPGIKTVGWQPSDPIPEKIIGATVDMEIVEDIQKANDGRGILLKSPNIDTWMTPSEWNDIFATDGLGQAIKMRLYRLREGGGVGTPGQRITGYRQRGQARKAAKEFKKLGKVI